LGEGISEKGKDYYFLLGSRKKEAVNTECEVENRQKNSKEEFSAHGKGGVHSEDAAFRGNEHEEGELHLSFGGKT